MSSSETYTPENLAHELKMGHTSSVALVEQALARIEDEQGQGPVAFIRVFAESAREQAAQSDARRAFPVFTAGVNRTSHRPLAPCRNITQ